MKKILLLIIVCTCSVWSYAQGEIQFSILKSSQVGLPESVTDALNLKLKQVLTRNSAAASNPYNVFAIEPVIEIGESLSSEGLLQQVTLVKGELTLLAKNCVDGSLYHSVVIPLKGNATGSEEKAMKAMIANIKSTDTQFTRFIRIARQKIQDYYAANCATILQKAQSLYDLKRYQEALSYLSAISETLPCYEQAAALQAELARYIPDATPDTIIVQKVIEKVVEKPVEVEKIVEVEKVVEKPVIVERVVEKPVPQETPALDCEISISVNDLDVRVLQCYGNTTQRRITLQLEVLNRDSNITNTLVKFVSAFTLEGEEQQHCAALSDRHPWSSTKMPPQVKLKQEYYVLNVDKQIPGFSYVELEIRGAKVIIRNLPVEW